MNDAAFPGCAPFDPNPRRPRLRAPSGACDCHAHVFGPADRYPYSPKRGYTPPDAPFEAYRRMHETLGIERGVLTQPSVYGTDNRAILDAVAMDPQRLRAVVAVDADISDEELRRLAAAGARGVRVNLVDKGGMPFASFGEVERFAGRIAGLGWHVEFLVHVHEYLNLATRLRSLAVPSVIGHLGYMSSSEGVGNEGFRRFLDLVAEGRCWVKLSGAYRVTTGEHAPYPDVAPLARALIDTRPDRMLWGTDWPHPICKVPMPNDGDLLDLLLDWAPDETTRRRILVDNPARLYGFA
jgi:predicted TIM-barrel fold metal-dependent hydrolase